MSDTRFVDLMAVPPPDHDVDWLKEALQFAVELELSTIPPYLCGMWSIMSGSGPAYDRIQRVVVEEMLHLGFVSNMLVALGSAPRFVAPTYPGPLPGGVHPGLVVQLAGLSKEQIEDVYLGIELPEHPVAFAAVPGETFPTIGAFYDAISAAFAASGMPTFPTDGQLTMSFQPIALTKLATVADVQNAINVIKEQGEGTATSPDAPQAAGGQLAHYYMFKEILEGHELVQGSDGSWSFSGPEVPFPEVYPMGPVPAGGYVGSVPAEHAFDDAYATVLRQLEAAWAPPPGGTGQRGLGRAVGSMMSLQGPAVALMKTPVPGGGAGVCGPDFVVAPAPSSTTGAAAVPGFKADILPLFTATDIAHMADFGVQLDDYTFMKDPANAGDVYGRLISKSRPMPPPPATPWPPAQTDLFKAWMDGGYQP